MCIFPIAQTIKFIEAIKMHISSQIIIKTLISLILFLVPFTNLNGQSNKDTIIYKTRYNHVKYHNSGKLKELGHLKKGKKNGYWISFYENLKNEKVENYRNGNLSGDYWEFHPNGKIKFERKFKKGNKIGKWRYWDENGKLKKIEIFKNGKLKEEKNDERKNKIEYKPLNKEIPILTHNINNRHFSFPQAERTTIRLKMPSTKSSFMFV